MAALSEMMDARLIGRPSHSGGWQLPQDQLLPRGCAGGMFLSQGHDRCLAQDRGSSSQRSSLGWWLRGQLCTVPLCFRILRIVSSSRPPVKAERVGKRIEVLQTNGARGELGLPLPRCRAEGIRWLSGGWDKLGQVGLFPACPSR